MPGVSKTAQAVVATRCLEDSSPVTHGDNPFVGMQDTEGATSGQRLESQLSRYLSHTAAVHPHAVGEGEDAYGSRICCDPRGAGSFDASAPAEAFPAITGENSRVGIRVKCDNLKSQPFRLARYPFMSKESCERPLA